jgi:hypothetical protein
LLIVIADFNFDLPGLGVLKRVPQRLSGNPVNFLTQDGLNFALRLPL